MKPQSQDLNLDAYREQQVVTVLYGNARSAFFGSFFNMALATFILWDIYSNLTLMIWASSGVLLNSYRWYNSRLFDKTPSRHKNSTWINIHRFLTCLSGCLYGLFALIFFNPEQPVYQALVVFLVGGMGAAAVGTYAVDLVSFRLFFLSSVLPLIFVSFLEQSEVYVTLGIMLISLTAVMLRSARQGYNTFMENFDMSYSLTYRATHDGLVGLLNRDEFKNIVLHNQSILGQNSIVSMIFIDLDNFKILNDTFGHQAGDDALVKIAEIIRSTIRKDDIAARFGGDEFMIFNSSDNVEAAETISKHILNKLKDFQSAFPELENKLGASIGIGYSRNVNIDYDKLLTAADKACYQAKESGKGTYCKKEIP